MTEKQLAALKELMLVKIKYNRNQFCSIPELLFGTVLHHGVTIQMAKDTFLDLAKELQLVLHQPQSIDDILLVNIEGEKGKKRILQWYVEKDGIYLTHYSLKNGLSYC